MLQARPASTEGRATASMLDLAKWAWLQVLHVVGVR